MLRDVLRWAGRILPVIGCLLGSVQYALGQTVVERSVETRFQLDLHVSEEALMAYLPTGWTPNVAARGPAKDANLRLISSTA